MKCCVKICKNNTGKKLKSVDGITFHSFPADEMVKSRWLEVLDKGEGWSPTIYSKVCSSHFRERDFFSTKKGFRKIHLGALPTLNMGNKDASPSEDKSGPEAINSSSGNVTCDKETEEAVFRVGAVHAGRSFPETRRFTLDPEVLTDLRELSDKIQSYYPTVLGKSFTLTSKGNDGDQCEYVFSSSSLSRKKGEPHKGLRCNECGTKIVGFRYKCVTCVDYDLCGACEALGSHHQHVLMRIARPFKHKNARALVQYWCNTLSSVGISSLEELMEPEPATEPDDCDEANFEVYSHGPATFKCEPVDEDKDEADLQNLFTSKKPLKRQSTTKKSCNKRPAISSLTSETTTGDAVRNSVVQVKVEPGESAADFDVSGGEPVLSIDRVKVEEDDPLATNEPQTLQKMDVEVASRVPIMTPGDQCFLIQGDQSWIVQGQPQGTMVAQAGTLVDVSGTHAAQSGILVTQTLAHSKSVAQAVPNVGQGVTNVGHGVINVGQGVTNVIQDMSNMGRGATNAGQDITNVLQRN